MEKLPEVTAICSIKGAQSTAVLSVQGVMYIPRCTMMHLGAVLFRFRH